MKIQKLFDIFQLFKKEGVELSKLKFGEIKSADGKWVIAYQGDMLEAGMPVFVIDGGQQIPAPDGEIVLEDGRVIIIEGGEGIVKEVKEKEAEPTAPASPEPAPMSSEPTPTPEERMSKEEVSRIVQETVRKFQEESKAERDAELQKFKSENEILMEAINGLATIVKKIADEPVQTPAKPVTTKSEEKFSAQEQIDKIVKLTLKK